MSEQDTHLNAPPIDELWLHDWAAVGIAAIERYLAKQAAFQAFLATRNGLDSKHGDSAA